ncbi:MAG TPA: chemotaxis-specific protein-glutamate methyltransferase CheB [Gemmataceae bacterium]|nr:chemotaxis-specific protein-glutamate methyltransferase CheB [Gemmataceae bacterium]
MRVSRVLVVGGTFLDRVLLSQVLNQDAALQVVGLTTSGPAALAKIAATAPDLVVLTPDGGGADGLPTLAALLARFPDLPVILFSDQARRRSSFTLEALALGASDYVTAPARMADTASGGEVLPAAAQLVREELAPRVKLFARSGGPTPAPARVGTGGACRGEISVVAVGVSSGGPAALAKVLPRLPSDFPVPVLIVQHMPAGMTQVLANSLTASCHLRVAEGVQGAQLRPGTVWLAPGGAHMGVFRFGSARRLRIHDEPPENSCRPSADVLFRSVANAYGAVLAVVLTGMGQDGLRGCEAVRAAGGEVLAQDEASSTVWGMPGSVVRAGIANLVLPLGEIGQHIARRVGRKGGLPPEAN